MELNPKLGLNSDDELIITVKNVATILLGLQKISESMEPFADDIPQEQFKEVMAHICTTCMFTIDLLPRHASKMLKDEFERIFFKDKEN